MDKLEQALKIAKIAHAGQKDKGGKDYFEAHVMKVVDGCKTEKGKIAAALHDVIEDTNVTMEDLEAENIDKDVLKAVGALTHNRKVQYFDYIRELKNNAIAREVKISDLLNNMDMSRLQTVSDADIKRETKYVNALKILLRG